MSVTFMITTKRLLVAAAIVVLTSRGLATNYEEFVKDGYRWAAMDGPFACPAKSDVQVMVENAANDELRLHMVEQLRAYYLVRGSIVKVLNEETATGLAQIQIAGIVSQLWTLSRFLSIQPIPDLYGSIETPTAAGFAAPITPSSGSANP
jgi:hypothetical protein